MSAAALDPVAGVPHPGRSFRSVADALDAGGIPHREVRHGRCGRCGIVWLWAGRPIRKLEQPRRCLKCGGDLAPTTLQARPREWRWHPGSEADRDWATWAARLNGPRWRR